MVSSVESCTCVLGSDVTGEGWLDGVLVSWDVERGDELDEGGMATDIMSKVGTQKHPEASLFLSLCYTSLR